MESAGPTTSIERIRTPDGRDLEVVTAGPEGPDVLLYFHGTPSTGEPFAPWLPPILDRGLRFVAFSRAGYAGSTRRPGRTVADVVDDARAVLDHVRARAAWAIGWSGGGPHALACAALIPDRVRAVATLGGVAPTDAEGLDWLAGMGAENLEEFGAIRAGPDALEAYMTAQAPAFAQVTPTEVAAAFGDLVDDVDRGSLTGEFAEFMAAGFRNALGRGFWGWFDDDLAIDGRWAFDLSSIRVPAHIWQGRHDRMVPFSHGVWLADHVGGCVPHLFADEGHLSIVVGLFDAVVDELLASGRRD